MSFKTIPKPSFLDKQDYLGFKNGTQLWRSKDKKRHFTWDGLHGEIEVFNKNGNHLGSIEPIHGELRKEAVAGRYIDVN
jgi:hypothetical protein